MRRRVVLTVAGAMSFLPIVSPAQQRNRLPRIGVLIDLAENHTEAPRRINAFRQRLDALGWRAGDNMAMDVRWAGSDLENVHRDVAELLALEPAVILASGSTIVARLRHATRDVPIVFTSVFDPIAQGFVASLARPGGNLTGFTVFEPGVAGKWLELLKEIAPGTQQVTVLQDQASPSGPFQTDVIRRVAPSFGLALTSTNLRDASQIERELAAFAREPLGALIVAGSPAASRHRDLIVSLAARHRLPAIYAYRQFVSAGGLLSYGIDLVDSYGRAAVYVDRILRGARPADLPVQAPTRYELVINTRAAMELGITVPPTLLARADEVIE
jgi:putative tryptophan/tyrosine transport system substrate-binding protein